MEHACFILWNYGWVILKKIVTEPEIPAQQLLFNSGNRFFFNTVFVSSHMYPENPEGTQVIVGSMNMGYISNTARNRTHNLFRPKREPIPLTRPQLRISNPFIVAMNYITDIRIISKIIQKIDIALYSQLMKKILQCLQGEVNNRG